MLSAVGVLAVQSLLIVGLLYQRRARQRAESESRRNLALAADASRRQTMSALTSSIGHELGQPLGSIMHNAQALQMMVTANRATPDTIGEILSDIQTQGVRATQIIDRHRTMLTQPSAGQETDRSARRHRRDPCPCRARHERAAGLGHRQSVVESVRHQTAIRCSCSRCFVNLVMNAMDAMAETPPARRHVTISSDVRAADVDVSVRDTGPGLPAHILDTLFTPFVTTKARGLGIGLTIVRSIVDAHGGTIVARNNPEGGATFTVTLRCSESAAFVADALH